MYFRDEKMIKHFHSMDCLGSESCDVATAGKRICVGNLLRDCGCHFTVNLAVDVVTLDWTELAQRISQGMQDGSVFSAALSTHFDCTDIARLLHRGGFRGRYRVVAPDIPNRDLIRREVAAMCPGLDFDIEEGLPTSLVKTS